MQDEISYTVLLDMAPNGEWGHGYWSNEIETHARFHLDGIHLLISQYEKTGEQLWLEAAERSMSFVFEHLMEHLDDGSPWFLHDTIEDHHRHHFQSTLFGKTPGNSLCINTHIQALTVLYRLSRMNPEKTMYLEKFENGVRALRRVLDSQPGEVWYKILMNRLMKRKTRKSAQSVIGKLRNVLRNVLEGFLLPRFFWFVRRRFPRIVFPGGFTERDLTLSFFSHRYHIINLKDLLSLYQLTPTLWLRDYIEQAFGFVSRFLLYTDIKRAVAASPYYIEFVDILFLYSKLIGAVPSEEIRRTEEAIFHQTGGYSLDYASSELVRGKSGSS
jgi:hypothetical protein